MDPVEAELFDRDGFGNVQVALLPHETLFIPFTYLSLLPYTPRGRDANKTTKQLTRSESKSSSYGAEDRHNGGSDAKGNKGSTDKPPDDEIAERTIDVKMISATHGHIAAVLKVELCPRGFTIQRVMRFYEPENSIMKKRIQLVGYASYGDSPSPSKYVHCVESNMDGESRVVVEWGPSAASSNLGAQAVDVLIRYRCGNFPSGGDFFVLVYDDPYQGMLHEV